MGPERSHDAGDAPDNPFRRLRSRTLIPWVIVGGMGLGLVLAFAGSPSAMAPLDSPIRALISGLALYGLPWAWIVWACRKADVDLGRLIGRVPAGYNWLPAQSRTLIVPIAFHAANNLVGKVVGDALAWEEALAPAAKLEE